MAFFYGSLLHGRKVNASTGAAEFEVTRKTIWRDVAFLKDSLGIPISYDAARGSYVLTPGSNHLLPWWMQVPKTPHPSICILKREVRL